MRKNSFAVEIKEGNGTDMFGNRTLDRLNQMLDEAMNGTFQEADYDETKLSRLESKWKQFLGASALSRDNLEREKENVKQLVSDISHQTRTPMTNIKMYAELLEENLEAEEVDREKSRMLLEEIIRQTEKLEFLIQSLTKLSRLESNVVAVKPEKTSLQALISEAVTSIRPKAGQKNIRIDNTYEGDGTAFFDLKWTKEALENILDNAVKYSPADSRITVVFQRRAGGPAGGRGNRPLPGAADSEPGERIHQGEINSRKGVRIFPLFDERTIFIRFENLIGLSLI